MQSLKDILESKKFVTAILTVIAMIAATKGFDVDVSTCLLFATPIMVAIGAQGWADSGTGGTAAQKRVLAHQITMARIAQRDYAPPAAMAVVKVEQPKEAGFFRLDLALVLVAVVIAAALAGCPGAGGSPAVSSAVSAGEKCALGEGASLVTEAVKDLQGPDYEAKLGDLASAKNLTQDAVACLVQAALAALTATTPATSEPTPVVLHARAFLDARKK